MDSACTASCGDISPGCRSEEGRRFPCPWRMELGQTSHGCPVAETTFLQDLKILNNSGDSRSWDLLQPLYIARLMLPGLAKVCIALKCFAIKSQSPSTCLGRSRTLGIARSPKKGTAAAQKKQRNTLFFLFCRDGLKTVRTACCVELHMQHLKCLPSKQKSISGLAETHGAGTVHPAQRRWIPRRSRADVQ